MSFAANTTCLNGRYTLLSKLGAGGQAEVWRARDAERGEEIALKILKPDFARSSGAWEALQREHALVSRMDHPRILKVFAPERDEQVIALPMELAPGGDLRRMRCVSYLEIGPVLLEVAEALAHAHALGIVHRDLKPENVLFDARGHVRLVDFGISGRIRSSSSTEGATGSDSGATAPEPAVRNGASPFTASPEQLRGEPPAISDDIYGLGALAYDLLSGHPPYYPRFELKRAIEEPVERLKPAYQAPERLISLVMAMLAKSPQRRPVSMREVIEALDTALNDTLIFEYEGVESPPFPGATAIPLAARDKLAAAQLARDAAPAAPGTTWLPAAPEGRAASTPDDLLGLQTGIEQDEDAEHTYEGAEQLSEPRAGQASMAALGGGAQASIAALGGAQAGMAALGGARPGRTATLGSTSVLARRAPQPPDARSGNSAAPRPREPGRRPNAPPVSAAGASAHSARLPEPWRRALESAARRDTETAAVQSSDEPASSHTTRGRRAPDEDLGALWDDIKVERTPDLMRLEPQRRSRWPWALLALVAAAVAVVLWLPPGAARTDSFAQLHWPSAPDMLNVVRRLADASRRMVSSVESSQPTGASGNGQATHPGGQGTGATAAPSRPDADAAGSVNGSGAVTRSAGSAGAPEAPATATNGAGSPTGSAGVATPGSNGAARPAAGRSVRAALARVQARLATLDARGAASWGGLEYANVRTRIAAAISADRAGDRTTAKRDLAQAEQLLKQVEGQATNALAVELNAGERALQSGDRVASRQAFELAYRIDDGSSDAVQGLQRSRMLDGVFPLLADALNAETARNYSRAAQDYGQVLALDPNNVNARAGLRRATTSWGANNYAGEVSAGFAALGAGRLDEARTDFRKALAINRGGREALEGLDRVDAAQRSRGLAQLRSRAATLEAQERWGEALDDYNGALRGDPSLSFARAGKARAESHLDLTSRLQGLVDSPEELASPAAREVAVSLIHQADSEPPSQVVLRSLAARLSVLLSQYDKTVHLALVSDNETEVEIPQIGSFGTFSRREIDLKPGTYTVIGTRAGYRAVRRDVTVAPGQDVQTISVRCEEPI